MPDGKSEPQGRKEAEEAAKPQHGGAPSDAGVTEDEDKSWLSVDVDNSKKAGTAEYVPPVPPKPL